MGVGCSTTSNCSTSTSRALLTRYVQGCYTPISAPHHYCKYLLPVRSTYGEDFNCQTISPYTSNCSTRTSRAPPTRYGLLPFWGQCS